MTRGLLVFLARSTFFEERKMKVFAVGGLAKESRWRGGTLSLKDRAKQEVTPSNLEQRMWNYKNESPHWKQTMAELNAHRLGPLQLKDDKLATLALISAGRRGLLDYATLYGQLPPPPIVESVMRSQEWFINSSEDAVSLFNSSMASMADFMSIALDNGSFDDAFSGKLGQVFTPIRDTEGAEKASLRPGYESSLGSLPSVRLGLEELTKFHERHLRGRLLLEKGEQWTWGHTAHLTLIVMTSMHWQVRCANQFGSRITGPIIASIALEQITENDIFSTTSSGTAIRLLVLHALAARSATTAQVLSAPPAL